MSRVLLIAVALVVALGTALGGCGSDDGADGADRDDRQDEEITSVEELPHAEGVSFDATPVVIGDQVTFDFTLTNDGDGPVAVADPADGGYTTRLEEGAIRLSFLRAEASSGGGDALPPDTGRFLRPGDRYTGTARVVGGWLEPLPVQADLCVEVVVDDITDQGDGTASFPYRDPGVVPTVACSPRVTVE